ncbi:MAG: phosphoadenylyl-sulfate reductase [Kineosporiaceae bacterium]|nr:phosphoadenylyl-sulfate reductase [Aeromicrobium sp.]
MSNTSLTLVKQRERAQSHEAERADNTARRASEGRTRRSNGELKALADRAEIELADASTDEVAAWAASEFGDLMAVACSMADAVLPHVIAKHLPWVDTLFLETGYHFAETEGTRDAVESSMQLTIVDVMPKLTVAEQDEQYGAKLHDRDPALCCQLRKVEPLAGTLGGYEAWVTGVRRDEAPTRANTPLVTWDDKNGLVKINPLAAWSFDDLIAYADANEVILNPLLNDGYPSIGCAPCTRRVAPGEDPRAGRWAGLDKTECGLHT